MGKLVQSAHVHVPFSMSGRGVAARAGLTVEVLRRRKSSTRRRRSRPQPALYTGRLLEQMLVFKHASYGAMATQHSLRTMDLADHAISARPVYSHSICLTVSESHKVWVGAQR